MDAEAKVLDCAMDIGEEMLKCGAEISRVEDSIERICLAYGAPRVDVFTITSSIVVTLRRVDGGFVTQTRRIRALRTNLDRLDRLNALSRDICRDTPDPARVAARFREILSSPAYPAWVEYAGYALIAAAFSVFFGGTLKDALASAVIGLMLRRLMRALERLPIDNVPRSVLCSLFGGTATLLALKAGLGDSFGSIAIGNVMLLIPGIPLTNALRDMIGGDTMSGLLRLCDALLVSVAVAIGFALAEGLFT